MSENRKRRPQMSEPLWFGHALHGWWQLCAEVTISREVFDRAAEDGRALGELVMRRVTWPRLTP